MRVRADEIHVVVVEVDHEHSIAWILRELVPFLLRVRIAAKRVGRIRFDADELEAVNGLRLAVLEDLKVCRRQSFDDAAVSSRVDIHLHEVGAAAENGLLLWPWRRGLLRGD